MPEYLQPPIVVDPVEIADAILADLAARIPGFQAAPGNIETLLAESFGLEYSTLAQLATDATTGILRYLGPLQRIPSLPAVLASAQTTWTFVDAGTYLVPAGTLIGATDPDGNLVAFRTIADFTGTSPATIQVEATETGDFANGLSGTAEFIDALAFVTSVAIVGATSGGRDDETDDAYLDRYVDETRLLAPLAILPGDFEVLARRVPPVYRAVAFDNTLPNGTTGVEGAITIAVVDEAGANVPSLTPVQAALDGTNRVLNLAVSVINPTRTAITVAYAGKSKPGRDPNVVDAAVEAALLDFLSPASWGNEATDGDSDEPNWRNIPVVRFQDVVTAINSVDGFDYYTTLTVNGGTADVAMSGLAPLPTPSVSGTVTAP